MNPSDYDKIGPKDRISVVELETLAKNKPVKVVIHHSDQSREEINAFHTMSEEQIEWFKAGSALNALAQSH